MLFSKSLADFLVWFELLLFLEKKYNFSVYESEKIITNSYYLTLI